MTRFDYEQVKVLAELREQKKVSQERAATFFGYKGRDTISKWELGKSRPRSNLRSQFLVYLVDILGLRNDKQRLQQVWNTVMVNQWEWDPLLLDELWQFFPHQVDGTSSSGSPPSFLAPPRPRYKLIGRDSLVLQLKQQLLDRQSLALSALNGLPGVGKTALAIALAYHPDLLGHFTDGVLWARLGRDAQEVDVLRELHKWGRALGITPEQAITIANITDWVELIHQAIGLKRMLLVVDDAWQIELALNFKLGGPNCGHLITTRLPQVAQDFAGTRTTLISELSVADGLDVLREYAPLVVEAEPEQAEELVKAVGGLPLALMLLGRRLGEIGLGHQTARIKAVLIQLHQAEERLKLQYPQGPLERHPSMPYQVWISLEAVIDISYEILDLPQQQTLHHLSVFPAKPNSFSIPAAEAVADLPSTAIYALVDAGLLEPYGRDRYTLHQTIADFARRKLSDSAAFQRLAEFYIHFSETFERDYDVVEEEMSNILAALDATFTYAMPALLARGANALADFLETRGLYDTAEHYLQRALEATEKINDQVLLVRTLLHLEQIAYNRGQLDQAKAYLSEALEIAETIDFDEAIIDILINLGTIEQSWGNFQGAEAYYQKGLGIAQREENLEKGSRLLQALGLTLSDRGDYEQAEKYLKEGLAMTRQLNHPKNTSGLLHNLGMVANNRGHYQLAEQYYNEGLELARSVDYKEGISGLLVNLGVVQSLQGRYPEALQNLHEGIAMTREIGHKQRLVMALQNIGSILINRGDYLNGEKYTDEGLAIARQIGMQDWVSVFLQNLGEIAMYHQDYARAEEYLLEGLAIARQIEAPEEIICNLEMLGNLYLAQQRFGQAEDAFQEGFTVAQSIDYKELMGLTLYGLAKVAQANDNVEEAKRLGHESLIIFETIGYRSADEVREWLATLPTVRQEQDN